MQDSVIIAAGAMALLSFTTHVASAQTSTQGTEIVGAAVRHLRHHLSSEWEHLPPGPILFDARVLERKTMSHPAYKSPIIVYELGTARAPQIADRLLKLIPAQPGDFDTARVCATDSPRTCTLGDGGSYLCSERSGHSGGYSRGGSKWAVAVRFGEDACSLRKDCCYGCAKWRQMESRRDASAHHLLSRRLDVVRAIKTAPASCGGRFPI